MVVQGSETRSYTLENMELEYETITNPELSAEINSKYCTDWSLSYEYVTLMRTEEWNKASTIQNMNINLPRKSMRGIILLFKNAI